MASADARVVAQGLAQLSHAVRRSTALNVATLICEPGTPLDDLFATADQCARWIGGDALRVAQETQGQKWSPPTE